MSTGDAGDPRGPGAGEPSEEELRAAYEAEIKKIRVEQIVLEQVVTLINLGMRRTGLGPGTEDERDLGQVQLAIESVRVLLPIVEQVAGPQAGQIRDALSQLQMAYVRLGGAGGAPEAPPSDEPVPPRGPAAPDPGQPAPGEPVKPGEPGPAQRTGRLWVPGQ